MIGYASHTGTKRNLKALDEAGWRILVSATGAWSTSGFSYGIDDGAYRAFTEWKAGRKAENLLDLDLFYGLVRKLGAGADWIVAPDIVSEGPKSLALTLEHLPILREMVPGVRLLIAVQEGHEQAGPMRRQIEALVGPDSGLFIGGQDHFKETTLPLWADMAHANGSYCHCARVNTARRIFLCAAAEVDSFDGTSATMYAKTLPMLDQARRHRDLFARSTRCQLAER